MKLEKVAVLGAGAVGAYVLWGLSEKPGIRLGVVAEGERARRLQNGIGINGKAYHPKGPQKRKRPTGPICSSWP